MTPLPLPPRHAQASNLSSSSPLRHFSLNLVLAKDSILINSYQPPPRKARLRRLPLNLVRLPILEELDGMSTLLGEFWLVSLIGEDGWKDASLEMS